MFLRQTPLYDNARLLAPDGEILCTCDNKKASWYVSKGLGVLESSDPLIVRLKFEPQSRPQGEDGAYYTLDKANLCVVCGAKNALLRKYIVPREYRRHFPKSKRDHQSHDVLLLCFPCHQTWSNMDLELRQVLAKRFNAPISPPCSEYQDVMEMEIKSVISSGKALLRNTGQIPPERVRILSSVLLEFFDVEELTQDLIKEAAQLQRKTLSPLPEFSHGKLVVDAFQIQQGGVRALEILWRKHFLSTMKPGHLPDLWSVEHEQYKLGRGDDDVRLDPKVDPDSFYHTFMNLSIKDWQL